MSRLGSEQLGISKLGQTEIYGIERGAAEQDTLLVGNAEID